MSNLSKIEVFTFVSERKQKFKTIKFSFQKMILKSFFFKKYLFDPEIDLTLKQNIPKVTRCLASLAKLVN